MSLGLPITSLFCHFPCSVFVNKQFASGTVWVAALEGDIQTSALSQGAARAMKRGVPQAFL